MHHRRFHCIAGWLLAGPGAAASSVALTARWLVRNCNWSVLRDVAAENWQRPAGAARQIPMAGRFGSHFEAQ